MRTIETLRQEAKDAKALKKQVDDLMAKVQAHESEKLSESEKLAAKVTALEKNLADRDAERRTLLVRGEVAKHARRFDAVDEDDVYRLLDVGDLDLNSDDWPKSVERAVKALLEAKPHLKRQTETRPGVPATPRANGTQTDADRIAENRGILRATGAYTPF